MIKNCLQLEFGTTNGGFLYIEARFILFSVGFRHCCPWQGKCAGTKSENVAYISEGRLDVGRESQENKWGWL